jgi:MtrB/PioB family decaheme-associated outer membrane protein
MESAIMNHRLDKTGFASTILLLLVLSAPAPVILAADDPVKSGPPAVDTSEWKCKYCPIEKGWSGDLDIGLGSVSDDSFKFGEYTGLNDKGGFVIGDATARYRGENAAYVDIKAVDLGLDSRTVGVEGGRQGKYKFFLNYDELPHFLTDTAATPFRGVGSNTLKLPPGWVTAGSTAGMTALSSSLRKVDIENERKRVGLGVLFPFRDWEYTVKYRHETREGTKRISGAFFFNAANLVEPVDYETDEVDVSASYTGDKWQAKFSYYGSTFRNGHESLTWDNPFTPLVAGGDSGQLALPPDNQFHQISAAAGYQVTDKTWMTGEVAAGRMTQDERFLRYTLNPGLVVPPLPRNSLGGEVDTLTANIKVVSELTDKLRLNTSYTYNDRDNKTPRATFNWVTTDSFVASPRTNLPYSFTRGTLKLGADYRAAKKTKLAFGYDHQNHERTFQEVDKTKEDTLWGKVIVRAHDNADITFNYTHSNRDVTSYAPVPEIGPPENPLLRKYNMADRTRDAAGLHVSMTPRETVNVGIGIDFARDDYSGTTIGLIGARETNISADTSILLTKKTTLHFFLNHQQISSNQAGSQTFSTADWFAANDDTVDTVGVGVKHRLLKDKLDVGANYTSSRSRGEVSVSSGAPDPPFPDLFTELDSLNFYATYRLKDNLSLKAAYWFERYKTQDWMLDWVAPGTIPNVLSFGEASPSYDLNVITLSVRYKF